MAKFPKLDLTPCSGGFEIRPQFNIRIYNPPNIRIANAYITFSRIANPPERSQKQNSRNCIV